MRVVSPLLKHVVYPGLSRSGYLLRFASSRPAVVTYHGILPRGYKVRDLALDGHLVSPDAFIRQVELLKKNYNIISPDEFLRWCEGDLELPRRSVLLTCDDGLRNNVTDMLPILERTNVRILFFVTGASEDDVPSMLWYEQIFLWLQSADCNELSRLRDSQSNWKGLNLHALWGELIRRFSALEWPARKQALQDLRTRLGIANDWDAEYSENEAFSKRFLMLKRAGIEKLRRAGMTIGAHTMSHPMLSQMSQENAFEEIEESRTRLENLTGEVVWALAYPFGNDHAVSARDQELARRAGFKCAFMNVEAASPKNRYAFPRIHVSFTMSLAELDAHVSGFHNSIRKFASAAMPA